MPARARHSDGRCPAVMEREKNLINKIINNNYDKLQTLQKALIQGAKIIHILMPLWQKINAPVFKPELDQTTSDCPPVAGCRKYH